MRAEALLLSYASSVAAKGWSSWRSNDVAITIHASGVLTAWAKQKMGWLRVQSRDHLERRAPQSGLIWSLQTDRPTSSRAGRHDSRCCGLRSALSCEIRMMLSTSAFVGASQTVAAEAWTTITCKNARAWIAECIQGLSPRTRAHTLRWEHLPPQARQSTRGAAETSRWQSSS